MDKKQTLLISGLTLASLLSGNLSVQAANNDRPIPSYKAAGDVEKASAKNGKKKKKEIAGTGQIIR